MPEASPRGTYLVIAEALRNEIEAGEGSGALPSEAEFMDMHGVSRNTIRRALKVLEADGVVESAPGIGWRVVRGGDRRSLAERMTDLRCSRTCCIASGTSWTAPQPQATRIGVAAGP
ncbi:hypothetical protein GCM10011579_060120 [Streptomyces albiflavescens]|uniref:HTH gntR-type domain-containing protein n=1 Tax=Streptomyces albiflavescens TaxID=1623582 RepID=A0A918D6W9_9ACTN|nr:hypothetical protein GCM10011579_060120 [Streptomyces albiflavescens]